MATIYDLKPAFQALLRPIVGKLAGRGTTPNQVTWAALGLSVVTGALVACFPETAWLLLALPLVLFVRMALNAIDGMLAKEHDMKSDAGAVLNEIGDVVSDAALYLPLAMVEGVPALWIVLFVIVGIVTESAGILAATISGERRYDGPMGKSDRAFVAGLIALLLGVGVAPGLWLEILLIAATAMGVVTVLKRCRGALK